MESPEGIDVGMNSKNVDKPMTKTQIRENQDRAASAIQEYRAKNGPPSETRRMADPDEPMPREQILENNKRAAESLTRLREEIAAQGKK